MPDGSSAEEFVRKRLDRPEYAVLRALLEPAGSAAAGKPVASIAEKPDWQVTVNSARLLTPEGLWPAIPAAAPAGPPAPGAPPVPGQPGQPGQPAPPADPSAEVVLAAVPDGVAAFRASDGSKLWATDLPWAGGGTYAEGHPSPRVPARFYGDRLAVGLPAAVGVVEAASGKMVWSEAAGKAGRAFRQTAREPDPAEAASPRLLRLWGVCDGVALTPEWAAVQRHSDQPAEPRFVVLRPAAADAGKIRAHAVNDTVRMMGPPLVAGDRLIGMTRRFGLRAFGLLDGRGERPEFEVEPGPAFDGPPALSDDGETLVVSAGGKVSAYSLRPPVYMPDARPGLLWQRDLGADRAPEIVSTAAGRVVLVTADGECLALDIRSASVLWSVKGVRSDRGPLIDALTVPGRGEVWLVFGRPRLVPAKLKIPAPGKDAGAELVALDPAAGKVLRRTTLPATGAAPAAGLLWMTPVVSGGRVVLSAVSASGTLRGRQELNVWVLPTGGEGEPAVRRFPLPAAGEADDGDSFPVSRYFDNMVGVAGDRILVSDKQTIAAYRMVSK
jgi:outer membrane protein assembly factor BamB